MRGEGNEWDWGAWFDVLKESIKTFEIKKINGFFSLIFQGFWLFRNYLIKLGLTICC